MSWRANRKTSIFNLKLSTVLNIRSWKFGLGNLKPLLERLKIGLGSNGCKFIWLKHQDILTQNMKGAIKARRMKQKQWSLQCLERDFKCNEWSSHIIPCCLLSCQSQESVQQNSIIHSGVNWNLFHFSCTYTPLFQKSRSS